MIKVHHLEQSRSRRVLWLLEELGLDYEVSNYQRDPETMLAPTSLTDVHPLGKSPVIEDDGLVIAESGAVIEYLINRYGNGRLIPSPGSDERLRYTYWLHYAEGSLMPWLLMKLVFDRMNQPPMPFLMRPIAGLIAGGVDGKLIKPRLTQHFDYIETELGRSLWFAGDQLTGADIQMSFPLEAAVERAGAAKRRPNISAFIQRISELPTMQRAIKRGGA